MNKRDLCIFCKQFLIDFECDDMEIECMSGVWRMTGADSVDDYRRYIRLAATCDLFEMVEDDE